MVNDIDRGDGHFSFNIYLRELMKSVLNSKSNSEDKLDENCLTLLELLLQAKFCNYALEHKA